MICTTVHSNGTHLPVTCKVSSTSPRVIMTVRCWVHRRLSRRCTSRIGRPKLVHSIRHPLSCSIRSLTRIFAVHWAHQRRTFLKLNRVKWFVHRVNEVFYNGVPPSTWKTRPPRQWTTSKWRRRPRSRRRRRSPMKSSIRTRSPSVSIGPMTTTTIIRRTIPTTIRFIRRRNHRWSRRLFNRNADLDPFVTRIPINRPRTRSWKPTTTFFCPIAIHSNNNTTIERCPSVYRAHQPFTPAFPFRCLRFPPRVIPVLTNRLGRTHRQVLTA